MKKKTIFSSDEATIELGVGKNMVNAIKYWLRAASMLEENSEGLDATELGIALFSEKGWDQYLEDEATLWMIHWLLATNFDTSTVWYWFFNCFHKTEFTQEEAVECDDVMGFTLFYPSYGLYLPLATLIYLHLGSNKNE